VPQISANVVLGSFAYNSLEGCVCGNLRQWPTDRVHCDDFGDWLRTRFQLLVQGYEAILDEAGRPKQFGEETAIAGLYLVGFRNSATGALREMGVEARRVTREIGGAGWQIKCSHMNPNIANLLALLIN